MLNDTRHLPVDGREGQYVIKYLPCPQAQKPEVKLAFLTYSSSWTWQDLKTFFFFEAEYFNSFTLGVFLLWYFMQTCGLSNQLCFGLRLINLHGKLYNVLALCFLQYIQMYQSLLAWIDFRLELFYMCLAWTKDSWALIFAKSCLF